MDAVKRAGRTFAQAFVGVLMLLAIPVLNGIIRAISNSEPYELDFTLWRDIILAATLAGVVSLVTLAWNALETKTGRNLLPK